MEQHWIKTELREILSRVTFHDKVIDEIAELIINSGNEKQFIGQLINRISKIEMMGPNVIMLKDFELLKSTEGECYSTKFKGKNMNLRMLFSFNELTHAIMLHCFYERQGSKKSEYATHIPIALERKREMMEAKGEK